MLYYFPKETASLVAERLDRLDVGADDPASSDAERSREFANRVCTADFIAGVAWCQEPVIRQALTELFARAEHVDSLIAALPGVADKELIRRRFEPALFTVSELGGRRPYAVLMGLAQWTPETFRPFVERVLKETPTIQRCVWVCEVLGEVKFDWDVEVLAPLLTDRRTSGAWYSVNPDSNEPRRQLRVCDSAAITLSANHPEWKFVLAGERIDLDKQIAVMREQLAAKK